MHNNLNEAERKAQGNDLELTTMTYVIEQDLDSLFLVFDRVLACISSGNMLFFSLDVLDADEEEIWNRWELYHTIEERQGQIYYNQKSRSINVVTEQTIFFYDIDPKTFAVVDEMAINNFLECSNFMPKQNINLCVTFKRNEPDFIAHVVSYVHDFRVQVETADYSQSYGSSIGN